MAKRVRIATFVLLVAVVSAGCLPAPAASVANQAQPAAPAEKKRITALALGNVFTVSPLLATGGTGTAQPGINEVARLVHASLTWLGPTDVREPQLAENTATAENGLWKVFPDGRMETIWILRPGVLWHDGVPFTTDDLIFGTQVGRDRELDVSRHPAYTFIDTIEAPNPRTIVVTWKQPYILADEMFTGSGAEPLPKHLLEQPYRENKAGFTRLPYFNSEFVGTGPFRLREYAPGSHLVVEANNFFVLGRPKIDEIEVKFIENIPTAVANLLAGGIDVTFGRNISPELAGEINSQWRFGQAEFDPSGNKVLGPQHLNPSPAIVADVRFKRALMHAMDRQQMVEALQGKHVPVGHALLSGSDLTYAAAGARAVRYEYDPRKSISMMEGLGYTQGPEGLFVDANRVRLGEVQIISTSRDINVKTSLAVADNWRRIGVDARAEVVPDARETDLEYRATFPAFEVISVNATLPNTAYVRSQIRSPENAFRGTNRIRYGSEELDNLTARIFTTIPLAERTRLVGEMVNLFTDQLLLMPIFHEGDATAIAARLVNVDRKLRHPHLWDVK